MNRLLAPAALGVDYVSRVKILNRQLVVGWGARVREWAERERGRGGQRAKCPGRRIQFCNREIAVPG